MILKRMRLLFLCLTVLTLSLIPGTAALEAQTYTEGSIAGTVFDPTNAVVANATVTIHNDGTNAELSLPSDGSGYFKAPELPAAIYTVSVNASGFASFREVNVIVQVGLTTEIAAHLQ